MRVFNIEPGPGLKTGLRDFGKSLNSRTWAAAIIATVFGCTGPVLVCLNSAHQAGFNQAETISWLWAVYVFGGLLGIFLSLRYKLPIAGAWSIPGAVMLGSALEGCPFNEAAGAFMISGIIVLVLGLTGAIGKVMKYLPLPIVMGMIAGCMFKFGTDIITKTFGIGAEPGTVNVWLGLAAIAGYFIVPRFIKRCPPALSALICGVIAMLLTENISLDSANLQFVLPTPVVPVFNPTRILSVSIPLAALVIGAENAQAMGVLLGQGYKIPTNAMTIFSGIGGIITSLFGGSNANVAGPMTAICAGEDAGEQKECRYTASVLNGIAFSLCGVFMGYIVGLVGIIPAELVGVVAGLAMIGVLMGAFQDAFKTGLCRYGAFMALVIGASGLKLLQVGAPFWALLGGILVSAICERKDLHALYTAGEPVDPAPKETVESNYNA